MKDLQLEFEKYLVSQNYDVDGVLRSIRKAEKTYIEIDPTFKGFYRITDHSTCEKIIDKLFSYEPFIEYNIRGHRMYSSNLKKYLKYLEYRSSN